MSAVRRPTPAHSRPQSRRESFPGKLNMPIVTLRVNTDPVAMATAKPTSTSTPLVPSVNIIPPPPPPSHAIESSIYSWNHEAFGNDLDLDLSSHIYKSHGKSRTHGHGHGHLRSMSTSSHATQYTQRTQSTQAIPTRTLSHSAIIVKKPHHGHGHYRKRLSGLTVGTNGGVGARGGATTPIQFLKRTIGLGRGDRGSKNININIIDPEEYQELESQLTEGGTGFQYAATPSFAELDLGLDSYQRPEIRPRHRPLVAPIPPSQLQLPALRPRLNPSPVPPGQKSSSKPNNSGQKRKLRFMEGFRKVEEIARKLGTLLTAKDRAATCCPLTTSLRVKCRRLTAARSEKRKSTPASSSTEKLSRFTSRSLRSRSGKYREKDEVAEIGGTREKDEGEHNWEEEEKTILIKNNRKGCCVFIVTSSQSNPEQKYEFPIPLAHLKSQLFVHSKTLVRALEEWNKHFQSPPPHWVINFVPKAYLRRGWHLAEAVTQYLQSYGLNLDDGEAREGAAPRRRIGGPWRVMYEAIGYKACLVGEGGRHYHGERWRMPQSPPVADLKGAGLAVTGDASRERHPSRVWERKDEPDTDQEGRGLVVGIAL
ncbi:hypothetical protein DFH27DRAFT_52307 [Peziza echinospora]|nr:hypothetical protein DFH27DRAFT_52307 [Peziza echinospora]